MRFIDLTGHRFGCLTVVKRTENHIAKGGQSKTMWLCRCDCGGEIAVCAQSLKRGKTQSCGCLSSRSTIGKRTRTHGMTGSPIYAEWVAIKQRRGNPSSLDYHRYGAIGRTMCKEWHESFESFYSYVSLLPHFGEIGYSLNRVDNNKGYEPNNVEWADDITQANNRRSNRPITYNGKTQTMAQWARERQMPYWVLSQRINKYHWDIEKAITTPTRKFNKKKAKHAV